MEGETHSVVEDGLRIAERGEESSEDEDCVTASGPPDCDLSLS
jgi:hypothetical protein